MKSGSQPCEGVAYNSLGSFHFKLKVKERVNLAEKLLHFGRFVYRLGPIPKGWDNSLDSEDRKD